jgi:hypothetical protein
MIILLNLAMENFSCLKDSFSILILNDVLLNFPLKILEILPSLLKIMNNCLNNFQYQILLSIILPIKDSLTLLLYFSLNIIWQLTTF